MLDRYIIPTQERLLRPLALWCLRLGITPNRLTIVGFVIGLAAGPAIASGHFMIGLALIATNRILDGLDGVVARLAGQATDRGAFLDIALDFFFYAAIPFAFVLFDPIANGLAGSFLLLSFIGTASSFLAFSVIAERQGLTSVSMPRKGLYYLGGITEGAETIAFFVAICLFPGAFATIATLFAVLALLTTFARWWWGWKTFAP